MANNNSIKITWPKMTALVLFAFANTLVLAKYSSRFTEMWLPMGIAYFAVIMMGGVFLLPRMLALKNRHLDFISVSLTVIMLILMVIVQHSFDPLQIRVDRWSGLHNAIQYLLNGDFPYLARTHMDHQIDPFPLWILIHIPFYLLGNAALSFFIALGIFLFSIRKVQGAGALLCSILLIICSVEIWYEVSVYSDYITNFLLAAAVVNFALPYYTEAWVRRYWFPIAIVIGLFTATRLSAFVPFAIMIFPIWLKINWKLKIMMLVIFAATVLLVFLPFFIWDGKTIMVPLTMEMNQGSSYGLIILVPVGLLLSMLWKGNPQRLLSYQALTIFLFAAVTFAIKMIMTHNANIFVDEFDLAYIGSLIPFAILALIEEKVKTP